MQTAFEREWRRGKSERIKGLICLSAFLFAFFPSFSNGAVGLSPGIARVEGVGLGVPVSLVEKGQPISISNGSGQDRRFSLILIDFSKGKDSWEIGYEPMPLEWVDLPESEALIPGRGEKKFDLRITIPDRLEFFNRKFVFGVAAQGVSNGSCKGPSIALRVMARILVETLARQEEGDERGMASVSPSAIRFDDLERGQEVSHIFRFRNKAAMGRALMPKPIAFYYSPLSAETPEQAKRFQESMGRYFRAGHLQLTETTWVTQPERIPLEEGKMGEIKVTFRVPKDAQPGKTYETLVFFDDLFALHPDDVKDWNSLVRAMGGPPEGPGERWKDLLSAPLGKQVDGFLKNGKEDVGKLKDGLLTEFNRLLGRQDLYEKGNFKDLKLPLEAKRIAELTERTQDQVRLLNRDIVEETFKGMIKEARMHGRFERTAFVRARFSIAGGK
jgi:hypothetical protein